MTDFDPQETLHTNALESIFDDNSFPASPLDSVSPEPSASWSQLDSDSANTRSFSDSGNRAMRALHIAISSASVPVVEALLNHGALLDLPDGDGDLPLHCCASLSIAHSKEALQIAAILIQRGARVDARDRRGRTALQRAAAAGHAQMVIRIVELGADVNEL